VGNTQNDPNEKEAAANRVLLVDDEPLIIRAMRRALEGAGYAVTTAEDGSEAAKHLSESSFDVVVSDISMPTMTGIELLRRVRQRDLDLPVVLMTGSPAVPTATQAISLGVLGYLIKPVSPSEMITMVDRAVQIYRLAKVKREALRYLDTANGDRSVLEQDFATALDSAWMAYQPIISWSEKRIIAFEALVRPTHAALPNPGALIHAAEQLGRVQQMGRRLRDVVAIRMAEETAPPDIFVNLHGLDLIDELLLSPDALLTKLAKHVVLEVTERASLEEVKDLSVRIKRLRALGFRIALDDLGAGYSGLTLFAQLQPEIVKIDMSLIRDIDREPTKKRLVRSMIDLCRDMGIKVVCEGVETLAERDTLVEIGGDLFQGFYFARPGKAFPPVAF
jgi:EAL domain-containing protein (putative c-di-GMP-specific phosphodiesterase class I)/DNA-binding NarL/FixJ family response regulator